MRKVLTWLREQELRRIYLHLFLDAFAVTLINLFIPIYLTTIGFSLSEVMTYLLIMWALIGLGAPIYARLITQKGIVVMMVISNFLLASEFLLLRQLETAVWLIDYALAIAVIGGVSGGLYFLCLQLLFVTYLGDKKQNEKTGKFMAMPKLGIMIGPATGGLLVSWLGFGPLFLISISILFLSLVPIFHISRRSLPVYKSNLKSMATLLGWKTIFLILYGIKISMVFLILPLALYLSNADIVTVGAVLSSIMILEALVSVGIGKLSDRWGPKLLIKGGAVLMSALLFCLGWWYGNEVLVYLSIFAGLVSALLDVPFESYLYTIASKQKNSLEFIVFKEICFALGRMIVFGTVIVFSTQLDITFYLGAAATVLFVLF